MSGGMLDAFDSLTSSDNMSIPNPVVRPGRPLPRRAHRCLHGREAALAQGRPELGLGFRGE